MRASTLSLPKLALNCFKYNDSKASYGIIFTDFTHRFSGDNS